MFKKHLSRFAGLIVIMAVLIPNIGKAENTVALTDSDGLTNLTATINTEGMETMPEGNAFFILCDGDDLNNCHYIADGTEYELTFTITGDDAAQGPVMVVVSGGDIDYNNSWTYNYDSASGEGTLTLPFTKQTFYSEDGQEIPAFAISIIFAVAEGEDGPPAEMLGSYLSTTVMDWTLIPPSPGAPYFGFEVTGTKGTSGFIHFYIPHTLIELLSYYEYGDYTSLSASDMAVFDGDSQVSGSVTELDDGSALVEVNVKFKANKTADAVMSALTDTVTKTITAKKKLPISLALKKTSIPRKDYVRGYGWTRRGKKGDKIRVYRKKKGKKSYKRIKTVITKKNGKFTFKDKRKKAGIYFYKVQYRNARNKLKISARQRVKVKK